jgi:hypothetical protein
MLTRILTAGGLAGSSLLTPLAAGAAPQSPPVTPRPPDGNCVLTAVERGGISVVDETKTRCYPTLAEATASLDKGTVTVATHYAESGGMGTAYVVRAPSCGGVVWYPSDWWQDRLTSTSIGTTCSGAKHYTGTNCSGTYQITQATQPQVSNLLSPLNNNVGCVKYT